VTDSRRCPRERQRERPVMCCRIAPRPRCRDDAFVHWSDVKVVRLFACAGAREAGAVQKHTTIVRRSRWGEEDDFITRMVWVQGLIRLL